MWRASRGSSSITRTRISSLLPLIRYTTNWEKRRNLSASTAYLDAPHLLSLEGSASTHLKSSRAICRASVPLAAQAEKAVVGQAVSRERFRNCRFATRRDLLLHVPNFACD